jgi:lipoprotein-anchoring transpeptidase ErfK/SrfK
MERSGWATRTLIAVLPLGLVACTVGGHRNSQQAPHGAAAPFTLAVAPDTGSRNLPVTTEIGTTVSGGSVSSVSVTDATGHPVAGELRPDGSSWVPAAPLRYSASYTATVTANGRDGRHQTRTTNFTTMADPGSNRIGTGLYFTSGQTYGVGMPIAIQFDAPIPDSAKASVERRLFVSSDPPQVGVWHWYGDDEVLYRPQYYWQPGTRLTVRAALGGLPVAGRYVDQDRGGTATIGRKQAFQVSNAAKSLYVYQDDNMVRKFPVSLGKASTPTPSGRLTVMSHEYSTLFATSEYRVTAYYDERITWGGVYLHAAPWSVGDQGHVNVSHGCINLSVPSAAWVYGMAQVGDPVTVTGTETHVTPGDGWTVWDVSWREYLTGSALPHPDLLAAAGAAERMDRLPG